MPRKRRDGVVKQLSNLSIDEISLVDRGANQHATVAISKALEADDYFQPVKKDNKHAASAVGESAGLGGAIYGGSRAVQHSGEAADSFKHALNAPTVGLEVDHIARGLGSLTKAGRVGVAATAAGGAAVAIHHHYGSSNFSKALDDMDVESLFNVEKSSFGQGGNQAKLDTASGSDPSEVTDEENGEDGNVGPGGKTIPGSTKVKGKDMPPKKASTKGGGKDINSSGYDGIGKSADFWTRVIEEAIENEGDISKHFPGAGQDPSQSPFPGAMGAGQPPAMQTPGVQPMGMGQPTPPPGAPTGGMPQQLPPDVIAYIQQLEQALEQATGGADGGDDDSASGTGNSDSSDNSSDNKKNPFGKSGDFGMNDNDLFLQELAKSLDQDDNREMISKAYEAVTKAEQRAEQAEQIAKAERDLRLEREFVTKAAELNTMIPSKELGPVLKRLAESVSKEDFQVVVKALKANDASNLFAEVGKRGGGDNQSILDEVNARAQEFVGKALTPEQAVAQVFEMDPRAYDQYQAEHRSFLRS